MAIDLSGKPIAITGASSGIGRSTALACAQRGMPVVVSARREERLREVVEEIRAGGGRAELVVSDVSEPDSGQRVIDACVDRFGSVYAAFANAGYGYEAAHHESSMQDVRDIFETNVFGSLRLIDAAAPHMTGAGAGHLLVCSSCLSALPTPYYGAYSATKSAQHHLASAMRLELRERGVFVSTVHPVGTKTEFFDEAARRSGGAARFLSREDGPFMQTPDRVADAIVACLRRPRAEVWTSVTTRVGLHLSALAPRLRDRALLWMKRRREREASRESS